MFIIVFIVLEFEGSQPQRISTRTAKERLEWVKCIQLASYAYLDRQIKYLQDQIAIKMGNRIESGLPPEGIFTSASDALLLNTASNGESIAALTVPTTKSSTTIKVEEGDLIQF